MKRYFESERLYFRRFNIKDSGRVAYLCNDPDLVKNLLFLPYPYEEKHAKEWISQHQEGFANNKLYTFAVILKEDGRLIGCISLSNIERNRHGEIGYWYGKEYWGKGYGAEALKAIINYAFTELGYHKVFADHFLENQASGRVMQKAGMEFEGVRKDHILKDNVFHTLINYAIINKDDGVKIVEEI